MIIEFIKIIRHISKPSYFVFVASSYIVFALGIIFALSDLLPFITKLESLLLGIIVILIGVILQFLQIIIERERHNMERLVLFRQKNKELLHKLHISEKTLPIQETFDDNHENREIQQLTKLSKSLETPVKESQSYSNSAVIISLLQKTINNNKLQLFLQPIIDLQQMRPVFFEAFSKIEDNNHKMIEAKNFITVAEQNNIISNIDNMLLLKIIEYLRIFVDQQHAPIIFFNISTKSLDVKEFMLEFSAYLVNHPYLAQNIIFEFQHDAILKAGHGYREFIKTLKDHGYMFSCDNTVIDTQDITNLVDNGYCYFKLNSHDIIKSPDHMKQWQTMIDHMSVKANKNIHIIATHIDDKNHIDYLRKFDISFGQGYTLGELIHEDYLTN